MGWGQEGAGQAQGQKNRIPVHTPLLRDSRLARVLPGAQFLPLKHEEFGMISKALS